MVLNLKLPWNDPENQALLNTCKICVLEFAVEEEKFDAEEGGMYIYGHLLMYHVAIDKVSYERWTAFFLDFIENCSVGWQNETFNGQLPTLLTNFVLRATVYQYFEVDHKKTSSDFWEEVLADHCY